MPAANKIRVLIVDDSALMRQMLKTMLSSDPAIEVVGALSNPLSARERLDSLAPDVMTLDVEMPGMNGLEFLEQLMRNRPTRVVMVSSLTQQGADTSVRALELGAVDVVGKPTDITEGFAEKAAEIVEKVKSAAAARLRGAPRAAPARAAAPPPRGDFKRDKVIAVGSSTGGVEALRELIAALPAETPPVLIVQHMPAAFTAAFARRLDGLSAMTVCEAADGQPVLPGHVYLAPGGMHLKIARGRTGLACRIEDGAPVSGHRPSADVLFDSMASVVGKNAVGVILTGMGRDGAEGLRRMRIAGASTIGQDEASCVVYGMPRAARELGAVEVEAPLERIAGLVLERCHASVRPLGSRLAAGAAR